MTEKEKEWGERCGEAEKIIFEILFEINDILPRSVPLRSPAIPKLLLSNLLNYIIKIYNAED